MGLEVLWGFNGKEREDPWDQGEPNYPRGIAEDEEKNSRGS